MSPSPSTFLHSAAYLHANSWTIWGKKALNAWICCDWVSWGWRAGGVAVKKERSRWMGVLAFWASFEHHARAFLLQSSVKRLKTYLFVEAEQLTVANPTVQHAVHMDVVGLEEKAEMNSMTWEETGTLLKSLDKQGKAVVLLPEQILRCLTHFVCTIFRNRNCCMRPNATSHCAEGGVFKMTLPLEGDVTPHSSAETCSRLAAINATHTSRCRRGVGQV